MRVRLDPATVKFVRAICLVAIWTIRYDTRGQILSIEAMLTDKYKRTICLGKFFYSRQLGPTTTNSDKDNA